MAITKTSGAIESEAWLDERGLETKNPHWYVEITILGESAETRMELNIYPEEWGYVFRRGSRVSSIRVTDVAFVHGSDDHGLLPVTTSLDKFGHVLAALERRYGLEFQRSRATVKTNLIRAAAIVRPWLLTLASP